MRARFFRGESLSGLGRVDSHPDGYERRSEMGEGQKVASGLLVAGSNASVMLQAIDQPFDQIATLVFPAVVPRRFHKAVFERWYYCLSVALSQQVPESVRVVSPVGNHCGGLMLTHE